MRMRKLCGCTRAGYEYYLARCPKCGLKTQFGPHFGIAAGKRRNQARYLEICARIDDMSVLVPFRESLENVPAFEFAIPRKPVQEMVVGSKEYRHWENNACAWQAYTNDARLEVQKNLVKKIKDQITGKFTRQVRRAMIVILREYLPGLLARDFHGLENPWEELRPWLK